MGGYEVNVVLAGSTAEIAGVKEGDLIVAVNKRSVKQRNYLSMLNLLEQQTNAPLQINLIRNHKKMKLTVKRSIIL